MQRSAAVGFYEKAIPGVMQVVGHTMAHCYVYKHERTHTHPKSTDNKCGKGLIRQAVGPGGATNGICIDAGMYLGARAYLALEADAGSANGDTSTLSVQFAAHERGFADSPQGEGEWSHRVLSIHSFHNTPGGGDARNEL